MDADFLAGVVAAAFQDELSTGPGRDDRSLLLYLALRTGARHLGNVVCWLNNTVIRSYVCSEWFYGEIVVGKY